MKEGAKLLEGTNDYRAFTEELQPHIENTVRNMRSVKVIQVRDEIRIDIVGTAFLRGMMRRMSGALFEVGKGKRTIESISELLSNQGKGMHRPVVLPAKGLMLMSIRYGRHPKDNRNNETASD
jgi:tRNA pseudouridine38-40 synthase